MNRMLMVGAAWLGAAWPLLVDSALKGATLLSLALVITWALHKASAAARHLVWFGALAALLILPLLSGLLPGWRVLPAWTASAAWTEPAWPAPGTDPAPSLSWPARAVEPALALTGVRSTNDPTTAREAAHPDLGLHEWVSLVWLAGFSLLALRLVAACWLQWRPSRSCGQIVEGRIRDALQTARRQLGLRRNVQVLVNQRRAIPMVWGIFRPRLLLPAEALSWDDRQLRSVLLHELGHIQRGDLAVQWVIQIVCVLHWFNPLVWFAAWRLHVERERACDDLVLASGVRASEYAAHLLHVATKLSPMTWRGAGALAMARPSRLEGRLLAVLNQQLDRRKVTGTLIMAALGLGLVVLIPTAMLKARAQNELTPPPGVPSPLKTAEAVAPIPAVKRGAPDEKPNRTASEVSGSEMKVTGTVTLEMPDDQSLLLEGKRVSLTALRNEIELLQRASPDLKVVLRPSVTVAYEKVVKVLDTLKDAGVSSVSLAGQKSDPEQTTRLPVRQAEQEFERILKLRQQGLLSNVEFDEARNKLDLLRAEREKTGVAELQLRQAEARLQRVASLQAQHLVAAEELEQAQAQLDLLRAAAAEQARAQSGNRDIARAEVEVAQADLKIAQANLRRTAELVQQKQAAHAQFDIVAAEVSKAEAKLRLAETQLKQLDPGKAEATEKPRPTSLKKERLVQLLTDEIKVAEGQAKLAREQREAGNATLENYLQAELEVLTLRRELAGLLGDTAQVKELMRQQIRALEDLEQRLRQQSPAGATSQADELRVRRQILSLQRQQAELE